MVHAFCRSRNVPCRHGQRLRRRGRRAKELARLVVETTEAPPTPLSAPLSLEWSVERKLERIAKVMYARRRREHPSQC